MSLETPQRTEEVRPAARSSWGPRWAARAEAVSKVYGSGETRVHALDGVDAGFVHGELTAVMGPSGSGKSTLMQCVAGLDRVSGGRVWIGEQELTGLSERALTEVRRDRVRFMFPAFNLLPTLTAKENITLPADLAGRALDADWVEQIVDALGLRPRLAHRPGELSGGQQQRVACARALVARPELILADEPTGNLDSRAAGEVLRLLRRSVDDLGQTVALVTHDPAAAAHADRVLFLLDGRVVTELRAPSATQVLETMAGLEQNVLGDAAPTSAASPARSGAGARPEAAETDPGGERRVVASPSGAGGGKDGSTFQVSLDTLSRYQPLARDFSLYLTAAPGAAAALGPALHQALAGDPQVSVQNRADYQNALRGQVDLVLELLYGLLALAVVVAVLGVVNTLALSVIERRREIGLLRAVGATRAQVRSLIRLEALAVSFYGTVLGLALGFGWGVAGQRLLTGYGITRLSVPWTTVAALAVGAVLIGLLAAIGPARRAARADLLAGLATT